MTTETARAARRGRNARTTPDWLLYFTKFLRDGAAIRSLVPSSAYLARAVNRDIDWANCDCVVELGAGTGPITAETLRLAPPGCKVIILERDADFCARLRERFLGADIVQADVADLEEILAARGVEQVDHFLCGLPLASFPVSLRERVLEVVIRRLKPEGTFRQLTHMPYVSYRLFRRYFGEVRFHFVMRNLPPAGYYACRQPRTS